MNASPEIIACARSHATSVDEAFLALLRAGGFSARVHSVFTRVVNVECRHSATLYTLACAGTDNAPATLVLDLPTFERAELAPEDTATCEGATLTLGRSLEISLEDVQPWSPRLPAWPATDMPVRWLRELIERDGTTTRVAADDDAGRSYDAHMGRRLAAATTGLKAAVLAGDLGAAYGHGRRLIGLGPGLTPSGDDFLVGLATICNQPGSPVSDLGPLLGRLVEESMDRTNDISHAAMRHAAEGRVRESISELVAAMARGDRAAMEQRGAQVLGIGATSGTDILTGMLAGLELAQARRS